MYLPSRKRALLPLLPLLPLLVTPALCQNFTISNGQIFTPGFAVLDSPQPGTPMGGGTAHVQLVTSPNSVKTPD